MRDNKGTITRDPSKRAVKESVENPEVKNKLEVFCE